VWWRTNVEQAEVLLELGVADEAASALPPLSERAELQDVVYDAAAQIRVRLALARSTRSGRRRRNIALNAAAFAPYFDVVAVAVEALVAARTADRSPGARRCGTCKRARRRHDVSRRGSGTGLGSGWRDSARAQPLLEAGRSDRGGARLQARRVARTAIARERRSPRDAERVVNDVASQARASGAALVVEEAREIAGRHGLAVPKASRRRSASWSGGRRRRRTGRHVAVRGRTWLHAKSPESSRAGRACRFASSRSSVGHSRGDAPSRLRRQVRGDAVMATFNATGTRLDHATHALEAALALAGKAAMLDLGVGIGIAVGPAVISRTVADGNVSVIGGNQKLAARLQAQQTPGRSSSARIAHKRVAAWLADEVSKRSSRHMDLKGFDEPQPVWAAPAGLVAMTQWHWIRRPTCKTCSKRSRPIRNCRSKRPGPLQTSPPKRSWSWASVPARPRDASSPRTRTRAHRHRLQR
jgi:hypothetical protein